MENQQESILRNDSHECRFLEWESYHAFVPELLLRRMHDCEEVVLDVNVLIPGYSMDAIKH